MFIEGSQGIWIVQVHSFETLCAQNCHKLCILSRQSTQVAPLY